MRNLAGKVLATGMMFVLAASPAAFAQGCVESVGEATAPSREPALRQAYESMLRAADANLLSAWQGSSQRVGEAPGYMVRKLTTNCAARGAGQFCRISATLCRG